MLYLFISDHDREPTQNTDSFEKQNGEGKCNVFGILLRIKEISNFFLMSFFFFYKSENCVDIDLSVLLALKKKRKTLDRTVFTDSSCLSPRPYSKGLKLTVSGEQNTDSYEFNKPRSVSTSSLGGKSDLFTSVKYL